MCKFLNALVVVMVLSTAFSFGQEYDLKKDVILKDKVPYAKISGKMGLLKAANLMVSSLNGDSLMAIKAWVYPSKNPVFSFLDGYEIRFVASGKVVIKPSPTGLTKEQLLNFIFSGRDYTSKKWDNTFKHSLIENNRIDPVAEAAFIEQFDNAKAIQWAKDYEAKEREILTGIFPIKKNTNAPLKFESAGRESTTTGSIETINVYQGNLIATIRKQTKTLGSTTYIYTFSWALSQKSTVGDKEIDSVIIATAIADSFPKIFVNAEGKGRSIEIPNPASAERLLTEYLISNGKL